MVQMYNTAGSTQFLLDEVQKTFPDISTLREIDSLNSDYRQILKDIEKDVWNQVNPMVVNFNYEITEIKSKIEDTADKWSRIYSNRIGVLDFQCNSFGRTSILFHPTFAQKCKYILLKVKRYKMKKDYLKKINRKTRLYRIELRAKSKEKSRFEYWVKQKIEREQNKYRDVHQYLEENASFLIGARGEEAVIAELRKLPDSYYVFNDMKFNTDEHWIYDNGERFNKSCQIDHLVVGPTGIFLLETKNWSRFSFEERRGDPHVQVYRASRIAYHCFFQYLKIGKSLKNVVVTLEPRQKTVYKSVDQTDLAHLMDYITNRDKCISKRTISKIRKRIYIQQFEKRYSSC